jgi:hypothetical protein
MPCEALEGIPDLPRNGPEFEPAIGRGGFLRPNFHSVGIVARHRLQNVLKVSKSSQGISVGTIVVRVNDAILIPIVIKN